MNLLCDTIKKEIHNGLKNNKRQSLMVCVLLYFCGKIKRICAVDDLKRMKNNLRKIENIVHY